MTLDTLPKDLTRRRFLDEYHPETVNPEAMRFVYPHDMVLPRFRMIDNGTHLRAEAYTVTMHKVMFAGGGMAWIGQDGEQWLYCRA